MEPKQDDDLAEVFRFNGIWGVVGLCRLPKQEVTPVHSHLDMKTYFDV